MHPPPHCVRQPLFERFVDAVLPELMRDPNFAFPGQTDHPFFWLAPAERLQILRSGNVADFLFARETVSRFSNKHEAAQAFFQAAFSSSRPDPLPLLGQRFDRFWLEVSPERWRLYSTWSYSMVHNASALIHQAGPGQGPEATVLCRAMIRYAERALGLTIEELEADRRRDGLARCGGSGGDSGFGWDATAPSPSSDSPVGTPKPADQVMSPGTANLYFPTPYGPAKHFARLPDIADSFFNSAFLAEYVRLSSEHAVRQQASLRAEYTPGVRRALEDSWGQMSIGHRRAFIATALSRLYVRPDPVQLHSLPEFRAWCEDWKATPKLHEHCIRD